MKKEKGMNSKNKKVVRAILIDPFTCNVAEIDIVPDLALIYTALSHATMPVKSFQAVPCRLLSAGDALFVDEEGRLKDALRWFVHRGFPDWLAGRALVIGSDDDGGEADAMTPVEMVRKNVKFFERYGSRMIEVNTSWV